MASCAECYYSTEGETDPGSLKKPLLCNRYPPTKTPVGTPQGVVLIATNVADPNGWCGEFKLDVGVITE
jgi:hypothetical protein